MVIGYDYQNAASRRFEEEIANAGVPPQDNQAPLQERAPQGDQDLVNFMTMTDGDMTMTFINLALVMTTQAQSVSTQAQSLAALAN